MTETKIKIDLENFSDTKLGVRSLKKASHVFMTYLRHDNTIEHGGSFIRMEPNKKWVMETLPCEAIYRNDKDMIDFFKSMQTGYVLRGDSIVVSAFDDNNNCVHNSRIAGMAKPIRWCELRESDVAKSDQIDIYITNASSNLNQAAVDIAHVSKCFRNESGAWDQIIINEEFDPAFDALPYTKEVIADDSSMCSNILGYTGRLGDSSRVLLATMKNAKGKVVSTFGYRMPNIIVPESQS